MSKRMKENIIKFPLDIKCENCELAIGFDENGNQLCAGKYYNEKIEKLNPCNEYAITFRQFEKYCELFEKETNLSSDILFWGKYGINQKEKFFWFIYYTLK